MKGGFASRQVRFDPTPEIFATESDGSFDFLLTVDGEEWLETEGYDEMRLVLSVWHPTPKRTIDLDRAYLELQGRFDRREEHWTRVAEIEPIVPAYGTGTSFDGWVVLPVFGAHSSLRLSGAGIDGRARLQIRSHAHFVS
ncbi:MAG: hypothetical protein R3244_08160 [Thermoanaerobaculia bacterium]|nr:hypothetical protein [Thermoanaerobaculia bacterium]